jgi:aminoglycoside phosphotransferase (APT) family kinase protein
MFDNMSYEPVAVLDWEMAGLAPVEVDLGWMIFMHKFFQVIAEALEFPGMPNFMMSSDVTSKFEELTGIIPENIEWFEIYAATRHAIIMSRINDRSVHFGESEWTKDVDSSIPHRDYLWSRIR